MTFGAEAAPSRPDPQRGGPVTVSVDAMGGDAGPAAVIAGAARSLADHPDLRVILHGPAASLAPLLAKRADLEGRCTLVDAEGVVAMTDKPSAVMRRGAGTSMWSTIEAVRDGRAEAAVSCGNTGALMAISMLRLRKLPGVARPAIACLWPSRNPSEFNVMLDVGADVRADPADLAAYAQMGASYAATGLGLARPRVGLLNVGTEEHKGRAEMRAAADLIAAGAARGGFEFVGFVEGSDLPTARVDVVVTDGFTGNIALKTAEGTAKLVGDFLKEAFANSILSKFAALLAMTSLRRLQRRIDPRRVNGGVFLGLNGTVVKSHGSADATGVAAAISLATRLAQSGFQEGLAARLAAMPAPEAAAEPDAAAGAAAAGAAP